MLYEPERTFLRGGEAKTCSISHCRTPRMKIEHGAGSQTYLPSPEKVHSNLSKMQSFSYRSHSLLRR